MILSLYCWLALYICTALIIIIGAPFEIFRIKFSNRSFYRKLGYYWGVWCLKSTFTKYKVSGLENIDFKKNYIVMGNHLSYFDIFLVFVALKDKVVFMAKKELFSLPFFGWVLKRMDFIPVNRENPREALKSLIAASKLLKEGDSILMFPEGTRSKDGKLQEFKQGGFILAKRSNLDILPFVIKGTDKVLRKDSKKINPFQKVEIKILPPISSQDKKTGELLVAVREAIESELNG
ncbi:1-acyl-sn-glycerol-3-phosphate acyltransferase [Deferribacter desulfuricans SSM1]|uniref:1-acyl-sn-glycerol-3-phosphate acyltransferase n=1 Tax=Deferribacter desulfuricans (strain DSM 14783 / JCM 11476 / NBRC 101012 / SSM1) TaxID=639282 RepID=D3PEE9_DEFDS|nr:lysophospholipid acyltransferase family protein [Deferribacter desulfuricans]BAI80972.1 1-acyl-sn-glycerol-3-phosphate acyltransferase [Deferribacter desulfuricans SSM1]